MDSPPPSEPAPSFLANLSGHADFLVSPIRHWAGPVSIFVGCKFAQMLNSIESAAEFGVSASMSGIGGGAYLAAME
jgi:hypothetical protein